MMFEGRPKGRALYELKVQQRAKGMLANTLVEVRRAKLSGGIRPNGIIRGNQ